jgi:hypothetical protein
MLYDDEQGDCITPEDVFERLEDDLAAAGAVIWVGISFEQSASTEYFRRVSDRTGQQGAVHVGAVQCSTGQDRKWSTGQDQAGQHS